MVGKQQAIIALIFLFLSLGLMAQQKRPVPVMEIPESFCVKELEWKLYTMINEYRRQYDLPPIALSRSLCWVASTHVKDLFFHHPDQGACNAHSWSDKGPWKPICYPGGEKKNLSVWDKPGEIAGYPGKGFEIVYWENSAVIIDSVISFWRSFDYFNSFLMNTGKWEGRTWQAIGIGILENYACAWFGEVPDPAGVPVVCGQKPPAPTKIVEDTEMMVSQKPKNDSEQPAEKGMYYIIVKSRISSSSALEEVNKLASQGYPKARIIDFEGKIRVSAFESHDRNEAIRTLREVKSRYKDAWLFVY